ncbi:MAG: galactokinase [Oscillospiraceae bacterium]|nr:galactokinase [Oscillospiraceae bacterium]
MQHLTERFAEVFHSAPERFFSAPGRTELGGNHTDHQHGLVLAAAIEPDARAAVALNDTSIIRLVSEGYPTLYQVDLRDLAVHSEEKNTTAALIRGVASGFVRRGYCLRGFDIYVSSTVLPGSGLSSSAAFEVLLGTAINGLFSCGATAVEIARIAQYAENVYFGKPCGLMDQMASSVGGCLSIDFADPAAPRITPVDFDFSACGHALCIIDSGASHAELTDEYAAIPAELAAVCGVFGKEVLRRVSEEEFYARLTEVRNAAGDRAALRAMHIFSENRRVTAQVEALQRGDFSTFLRYVNESGLSSQTLLQNVIPTGATAYQEVALSLALSKHLLGGRGAVRVHGGGFAGTIQAFVPNDLLTSFRGGVEAVLGGGSCHVLSIRSTGGTELTN